MRHRKDLVIYTYNQKDSSWESAIFEHHTTFETLAIEPQLKTTMIDDLDAFSKGKDFFKSVGRAWKRGYLLYGPPGTGKSSMVAAIANHMNCNIYDLQIQSVKDDAELRRVLTATNNRSILLIEDIDCGTDSSRRRQTKNEEDDEVKKKKKKPDLGVNIFVWSIELCRRSLVELWRRKNHNFHNQLQGEARPGIAKARKNGCSHSHGLLHSIVLKKLVAMYLKIDDHVLFDPIEKLVLEVSVTPAEVAQQLMVSKNTDIALKGLIEFIEKKKIEKEEVTKVEEEGEIEDAETNE
ncbi:P-loop containing nucleoside triphosphate hydrolase [Arabidopsis suecica]|uniref:P-loop containing nucleoside triphosphate hydrolase n=1 Tax=Arabidopsis suecica TaxID=45249 RepID=A0A8T2FZ19_ARASU|nr:P-loop containing nucleoside triphosphate hydrolase [Arabidopsis suecica]